MKILIINLQHVVGDFRVIYTVYQIVLQYFGKQRNFDYDDFEEIMRNFQDVFAPRMLTILHNLKYQKASRKVDMCYTFYNPMFNKKFTRYLIKYINNYFRFKIFDLVLKNHFNVKAVCMLKTHAKDEICYIDFEREEAKLYNTLNNVNCVLVNKFMYTINEYVLIERLHQTLFREEVIELFSDFKNKILEILIDIRYKYVEKSKSSWKIDCKIGEELEEVMKYMLD
jgi:hypothetical protein